MKTGTDTVGLGHNPILTDTTGKVAMTLTEAVPGHITGATGDITGVLTMPTLKHLYTSLSPQHSTLKIIFT